MKRIALFLLLAILVLPSCSSPATQNANSGQPKNAGVVEVTNWGEYIDESIFADFEKETGIKVNYTTYSTNEELYSKLKSGGAVYDVVFPSDYMVSRMIAENMLEPLDMGKIPNFSLVEPNFQNPVYDPQHQYSVPYMWGTVGLIYNSTMVQEPVDSWSVLFDPQYSGKILMFDNPRDAFGIAMRIKGYDYNTTDENQIRDAFSLLQQQKPLVQAYVMDQIFDKLTSNEAAIGPYYAGDAITMMADNPDLRYVLPKEGSNLFVDTMCVPKGAPHKDQAETFINFMLSNAIMLRNADVTGYSIPTVAVDQLDSETRSNPIAYPPADVLAKCDIFTDLPAETRSLYDDLWMQLKK